MANGLFGTLESVFGLPGGILDALWAQESSRGRNMYNPSSGAAGHFQIMPFNYKSAGIDPRDLGQSAEWTARYAADAMEKFPGMDPVEAIASYHFGGPDTGMWGPKTRKYVQDIKRRMGEGSSMPLLDASQGYAAAPLQPDMDYYQMPQEPPQRRGLFDIDPATGMAPIQYMGLAMMYGANPSVGMQSLSQALMGGAEGAITPYQRTMLGLKEREAGGRRRQADALAAANNLPQGVFDTPQEVINYMNAVSAVSRGQAGPAPPADAQKDAKALADISAARIALGNMRKLALGYKDEETGADVPGAFSGIGSGLGRVEGAVRHAYETVVQPGGESPSVLYTREKQAAIPLIAKAMGHGGRLSDQDIQKALQGLPEAGGGLPFVDDSKSVIPDAEHIAVSQFDALERTLSELESELSGGAADDSGKLYRPQTRDDFCKVPIGGRYINPADGREMIKNRECPK